MSGLLALLSSAIATALPTDFDFSPRATCTNSATSRSCWTDGFDIDTDYYVDGPDTGVVREYWLSVEGLTCAPDGVDRYCLTFNGTVPGPLITADWGDTLRVHVTNNLPDNGTTVHWHGLRQLNSTDMDGVPGVTQCPIAPGDSMTYEFRVAQYGSTWYHSHFTFQYAEGLFGPMIINGPASADYDEDLGTLFLGDWSHTTICELWGTAPGTTYVMDNILVNGTNTFTNDDGSVTGSKFEMVFEQGKSYRIRLINVAVDGAFDFHIDGHEFTIIATDLVPVEPFTVDHVQVGIGQRYDIIVEANADPGDYWIRSGWNTLCRVIGNDGDISPEGTGILRYDSTSTADPETTDAGVVANCWDQDVETLVPVVPVDVTDLEQVVFEKLGSGVTQLSYFTWTLNSSTLYLDWAEPTVKQVEEGNSAYTGFENVVEVGNGFESNKWVVLVINSTLNSWHPIHLHGHDFFILAQKANSAYVDTDSFNLVNPERRDVAVLPQLGYLAIAFQLDNPGAWLVHCHIAWHASAGLGMQFVESKDAMLTSGATANWNSVGSDTCAKWDAYSAVEAYEQDDSGI
ncbi:laccase-1 [Xylariaceae sp. FL1019]|nr:laccase-1 [Xylariaceae sp. FL1019]